MIYHVINANIFHQAPNIIRCVLQFAEQTNRGGVSEHFFILTTWTRVSYLSEIEATYDAYKEIFSEYNFRNFLFVRNSLAFLGSISRINKKDKLILHGGSSLFGKRDFLWTLFFIRGRRFCKRIILIVWNGGTLELRKNRHFGFILLNLIKKRVFSGLGYLITLSFDDENRAKSLYPAANVITTNLIMDHYKIFNRFKKKGGRDKKVKIMVSHSAFEHNNHFKTFELLAPFGHENIQVICPLSYGNRAYQEKIIEQGKKLFNEKFVYYRELLPLADYYALLGTLDIFIASSRIQTGLHVVLFGLCTGLKMYLRGNNLNYVEKLGFKTNRVSELNAVSFEEFIRPITSKNLSNNDKLARKCFGIEEKVEIWKKIYED